MQKKQTKTKKISYNKDHNRAKPHNTHIQEELRHECAFAELASLTPLRHLYSSNGRHIIGTLIIWQMSKRKEIRQLSKGAHVCLVPLLHTYKVIFTTTIV